MGNIGAPELLIILGVLVLIFGSTQLPKLARSLGQAQKEFKSGLKDAPSEDDEDKPTKGKSSK
jgi:sec-independent protein translocase protein TatA